MVTQSQAQHEQTQNSVTTLEPLVNQRGAKRSALDTARYNLNNCLVYAPFDARVTNLLISEGAYAHTGQQMFTLIDARTWWAVANFREGQLQQIVPGMPADVYVMSKPNMRFSGMVDSIGFGVTPDADVIVSNAVLQWVPSHTELLSSWARSLPANGWLAFQVPGNFDEPAHALVGGVCVRPGTVRVCL